MSTGGELFPLKEQTKDQSSTRPPYQISSGENKTDQDQQLGATSCRYSRRAGTSSESETLQD